MKNLFILLFCAFAIIASGQITCTNYLLEYNAETNQYDVKLAVLKGSTNSTLQRAQYTSQISIVVPTGQSVTLTDLIMPLQNNQSLTSTVPAKWSLTDEIYAPQSSPTNDFYSVTAVLSPSSFYNNLVAGDEIHLFSFTVGDTGEYNEDVRLFKKGIDPSSLDMGMGGGNFSNTFRLGGSPNLHNPFPGESCVTSTNEKLSFITNIYPNPFQNKLIIELPYDTRSVQIISTNGNMYEHILNPSSEQIVILTAQYPNGLYILRFETNTGAITNKKIVKF